MDTPRKLRRFVELLVKRGLFVGGRWVDQLNQRGSARYTNTLPPEKLFLALLGFRWQRRRKGRTIRQTQQHLVTVTGKGGRSQGQDGGHWAYFNEARFPFLLDRFSLSTALFPTFMTNLRLDLLPGQTLDEVLLEEWQDLLLPQNEEERYAFCYRWFGREDGLPGVSTYPLPYMGLPKGLMV